MIEKKITMRLSKKKAGAKLQNTNKSQITMSKITNKKTIKSFCGGSRGALIGRPCQGLFSKRAPLATLIGLLLCGMMLFASQSDIMLHQQGKKAIYENDWDQAIQLFQQLETQFPGSTLRVEALYWLAYSLEKQDKELEALDLLNRLIKTYKNNEWIDDAKILRIRISAELIAQGAPQYRQYIMDAVQTQNNEQIDVKMVALDTLIRLDRQQALSIMEQLYKKSKNPEIKENIIFILRRFGENKMISRLTGTRKKTGKITLKDIKAAYSCFDMHMKAIAPPRLDRRVKPVYPREALEEGVSGDVSLRVRIDKKGDVSFARAGKESHPLLAAAAEKSVRKWKFFPSTRKGERLTIYCVVTINFSIEQD
jgi:TonB family protein